MSDLLKRVERAEKLLEKGRADAALVEYLAVLEEQPENERILEKAADLSLSLGDAARAQQLLERAFRLQVDVRDLLKAKLLYRKLSRLRVVNPELAQRYAELLKNTNRKEASEVFRSAAQEFVNTGRKEKALDALEQAAALNPKPDLLQMQAELAIALERMPLASNAFVSLGVLLEKEGADPSPAYERAHQCDPTNVAACLGYGRALVDMGRGEEAIKLLGPLASYPSSPIEAREPYALALLSVNHVLEAEPYIWAMFERDPVAHFETVLEAIQGLLEMGQTEKALGLAQRVEEFQRKAGHKLEFVERMAQLVDHCRPDPQFLEYLTQLYNGSNNETEYARTLIRLFDFYINAGQPLKAFDALDRAVDVNPYELDNQQRMMLLKDKIDQGRLATLARKLGMEESLFAPQAVKAEVHEDKAPEVVLEDLLLEAELFLQYSMTERAQQKIHDIQKLFPDAARDSSRLHDLMRKAGMLEQLQNTAEKTEPQTSEAFARAAEIGRLIAQQTDPRTLISVVANSLGQYWGLSRCLGVLGAPGQAPAAVVEFCATGVPHSDRKAMARTIAVVQMLSEPGTPFVVPDVGTSDALSGLRAEMQSLSVMSLMAIALKDGDRAGGWLILEQCDRKRAWSDDESAILRSLADQVSLALQGIRLRSLVRTLGVTDERSGLLNRASYLDILLAEIHRSRTSGASVTVVLLELRGTGEIGEEAVKSVSSIIQSMLRATAVCFHYNPTTIAVVLPGTTAREASTLVTEIRDSVKGSNDSALVGMQLSSVIAEALRESSYEEEDIVTELINRADRALSTVRDTPGAVSIVLAEDNSAPAQS